MSANDYAGAMRAFKKSEVALTRELDRLQAAYDSGDREQLPGARKRAAAAAREAGAAWEVTETARAAFWAARRDELRGRILRENLQLLADFHELARRAGGVTPAPHQVHGLLAVLAASERPPHGVNNADVPAEPLDSDVLARADDEL